MSDTMQVLGMLKEHPQGVTVGDIAREIGTYRGSARIADLIALGFRIESTLEAAPNGKRRARYVLTEPTLW